MFRTFITPLRHSREGGNTSPDLTPGGTLGRWIGFAVLAFPAFAGMTEEWERAPC